MFSVFLLLSRGSCRCRWSALCFSAGSRTPRRCRWSCSASFCCSRAPPLQLVRAPLARARTRCCRWSCSVSFCCFRAVLAIAGRPRHASPRARARLAVAGGRVRRPFVTLLRFPPLQVVRVLLLIWLAHVSPLQVVMLGVCLFLSRGSRRCSWSASCFSSGSRTTRRCRWSCSASSGCSCAALAVARDELFRVPPDERDLSCCVLLLR